MEISEDILEKAKKNLEEKQNLSLCIKARICPKCGGNLKNDDSKDCLVCPDCASSFSYFI